MDKHVCTELARIERIEMFIDGNGRAGLNDRVSGMDEKLDNLKDAVNGMKSFLRWSIGTLIAVFGLIIAIIELL